MVPGSKLEAALGRTVRGERRDLLALMSSRNPKRQGKLRARILRSTLSRGVQL